MKKTIFDKFWYGLSIVCGAFAYSCVAWYAFFDEAVTNQNIAQSIMMATIALIMNHNISK